MIHQPEIIPFDDWTLRGRWWTAPERPLEAREATIIHHSVTNTTGQTDVEQAQTVEEVIYGRRIDAGFMMIAYSYLIGTAATIFEGRGGTYLNAANRPDDSHTGLTNDNTLSICFAGNYQPDVDGIPTLTPTNAQLQAAADLIAWLELTDALMTGAQIAPHRYVHATACPGDNLATRIPIIAELIHRSPDPTIIEENLMAPSAPLVQLYDDSDAKRTLAMWAGDDGHPVVYSYETYRPGVGIAGPGLSWVALAMFSAGHWVDASR